MATVTTATRGAATTIAGSRRGFRRDEQLALLATGPAPFLGAGATDLPLFARDQRRTP